MISPMPKEANLRALERYPISVLLWRYSLPAIIGMAASSLYNVIDAIFIGQWCGPYAITAMALVFPIMNLSFAVGALVGLGCSSAASIALGQKKTDLAFRILGHCVMLSIIFGIIFGWCTLPWLTDLLTIFGAEGATLKPAYDFMLITLLGYPISSGFLNLNHLMRASGYPGKAMVSLLISLVVNVASAPVFIKLLDWGMAGAALATVLGQGVALLWVLIHFANKRSVLHFKRGIYSLCGSIVRRVLTIGLPPFAVNITACLVVVVFNYLLKAYDGPMGVGAFGIVNRVLVLFVMVVLGITQGMQPIAGYNLGLGKYCRVRRVLLLAMLWATGVTSFGFLLVMGFPREIVSIFVDEADANASRIVEIASRGICLMSFIFPLVGSQMVIGNFFQAIGRPALSIFLSLTRHLIFLLPCLALLPRVLGERGIWLSQSVSDALSVILGFTVLHFFMTRYFRRKDFSEMPPNE